MPERPPHSRTKITEREVMEMLLRGDNVHELDDLEIIEQSSTPPSAATRDGTSAPPPPLTPRPERSSTDTAPAVHASTERRPPEDHTLREINSLEEHLQEGDRWRREPDSPLEGVTAYVDMDPKPRDASEIYVIDLHGCTRRELSQTLADGLTAAGLSGRRFVRLITGRGLHSPEGYPVLRSAVELWLARSVQAGVIAACAREDHIAIFAPDYGSFMARLSSRRARGPHREDP